MTYRLGVPPGSPGEKQLQLLAEMLEAHPEAQALRARLHDWLGKKRQAKVKDAAAEPVNSGVGPAV